VIVLDTNVVSEPIKLRPALEVLAWLSSQTDDLAVTAVTIGELLTGIRFLPSGKRREKLLAAVEGVLLAYPIGLAYDENAARAHAVFQERARRQGRVLSREDGMIAGICVANGAALATRNVTDFDYLELEVPLINPWAVAQRHGY
jgi:predicted nucleic acid-binding protein